MAEKVMQHTYIQSFAPCGTVLATRARTFFVRESSVRPSWRPGVRFGLLQISLIIFSVGIAHSYVFLHTGFSGAQNDVSDGSEAL